MNLFRQSVIARENLRFLKALEKKLKARRILSPEVEAERLVLHFAGTDRLSYFTGASALGHGQKKKLDAALKKRFTGIPLAHLTGTAGFYGLDFHVNRHVLIPRPETELLVEKTLELLAARGVPEPQILEVGAGSGCLAVSLTIARPDCKMTALELSSQALKIARKNALIHAAGRRLTFRRSDLFKALGDKEKGMWDVIVSNPPYVPADDLRGLQREVRKEPRLALDGGRLGLEIIEKILREAPDYLKPGGFLAMEIGKGQSRLISRRLSGMKVWQNFKFFKDYAGIDRVLTARKIG